MQNKKHRGRVGAQLSAASRKPPTSKLHITGLGI
jgi:hypothetical protein